MKTTEEFVALIREIPTDFPCLNDPPCEDATNPADRSESLAHHFDCPTLDAWVVVRGILAARDSGPVLLTRGSVIEAVVGAADANTLITATLRVVGWTATPGQLVVAFEDAR